MMKGAQAYFATQVTTTKQSDILLMLYDGAIKFLNQAKVKIEERDYAQKGILISKAMDVIGELDSSLNAEKGGEVAQNLHQLYFYCNTRLLRANMDMNTELVDEVVRILSSLREAFEMIKDSAPEPQAPKAAPTQQARTMMPGNTAQSAPKASAARATRAYGTAQPAPQAEAPEEPANSVQDAAPPSSAPEASNPAAPTQQASEPVRTGPTLVRPVPGSAPSAAVKSALLRKPGLPGAYGRQDPTR